jgi:hypothetical protein
VPNVGLKQVLALVKLRIRRRDPKARGGGLKNRRASDARHLSKDRRPDTAIWQNLSLTHYISISGNP